MVPWCSRQRHMANREVSLRSQLLTILGTKRFPTPGGQLLLRSPFQVSFASRPCTSVLEGGLHPAGAIGDARHHRPPRKGARDSRCQRQGRGYTPLQGSTPGGGVSHRLLHPQSPQPFEAAPIPPAARRLLTARGQVQASISCFSQAGMESPGLRSGRHQGVQPRLVRSRRQAGQHGQGTLALNCRRCHLPAGRLAAMALNNSNA